MIEYVGSDKYLKIFQQDSTLHYTFRDKPALSGLSIKEEYIAELKKLKSIPTIMYSGGIDSEIVVESCIAGNIPFRAVFVKLIVDNKVMNLHDLKNAEQYAAENNFALQFHEFDAGEYFESGELYTTVQRYKSYGPQVSAHLAAAEQLGVPVVFGGDAHRFNYHRGPDCVLVDVKSYGHYAYERFCQQHGGIGDMAAANSAIFFKYLQLQIGMAKDGLLFRGVDPGVVSPYCVNYNWKCELYRRAGFESLPKETKYTGFEYIRQHYSDKYNEVGTQRMFNQLFRFPIHRNFNHKYNFSSGINKLLLEYKEAYENQKPTLAP